MSVQRLNNRRLPSATGTKFPSTKTGTTKPTKSSLRPSSQRSKFLTRSAPPRVQPLTPIDTKNLDEIRGLAIRPDGGTHSRILVQLFAASQSLSRPALVSLLYEGGTYTRLESSGFRLDDKLVCIVEDELIKFRSLHNLGRVIDTSVIFSTATDSEVEAFAETYSNLFQIDDLSGFLGCTSRNARKYVASLAKTEALQDHTARTLQGLSAETDLELEIQNDKIVMPRKSSEITELMRFLNDGRYVGPISRTPFITNSRRPVPS